MPTPIRQPTPEIPDIPDIDDGLIQPDNVEVNVLPNIDQPDPQPHQPTVEERIQDERLRYWREKANAKAAKAKEREARISLIELKKRAMMKKYGLDDHDPDNDFS